MNLTGQPVYQKCERSEKPPTAAERKYWDKVIKAGCRVNNHECEGRITLHHALTGGGGRKNHKKVLGLCVEHHLGDHGINSLTGKMSRREWEERYGTEQHHLNELEKRLKCLPN